ncbi:MAG: PQQ-binding-like beta-propeller repeat protein [Pseudomonadota bacterium]
MRTIGLVLALAAWGVSAQDEAPGSGAAVYDQSCANCHEGQAAKAPHRTFLNLMAPDAIYASMTSGIMQAQSAALDDDAKRAVAEFLAGAPIGAFDPGAVAPACEGDALTFDWSDHPVEHPWGMTLDNRRYIPAERGGIPRERFEALEVDWALGFPGAVRARSQPGIAGGAVYVGSHDGTVYALDRETGCMRWSFRASAEVRNAIGITNWQGDTEPQVNPIAYFGDLIGRVYAVDAVTGEKLWMTKVDPHPNVTVTGNPVYFEGRIYVPVSSLEVTTAADPNYACCTFRGSIVALDARSGEPFWQTFTIDEPPSPTKENAIGVMQLGPSGAPIWNSPTIDVEKRRLYIGTGENYSSPADGNSDALIAFDLDSGERLWTYQATANDAWNVACMIEDKTNCPEEDGPDFDFGAGTLLAITPQGRGLVLGGQKSGVVHAVDRDTGELVWRTRVGRGGIQGGVHFGMAADDQRVYVPMSDFDDGAEHLLPARPGLFALDLESGEEVWAHPAPDVCGDREFCDPGISAAITVTAGVVIAGHMDGWLRVYDKENGNLVWQMDSTQPVQTVAGTEAAGGSFGGPGAVVADGRIFINSGYGIYFHMPGNLFLTLTPPTAEPSTAAAESP